MAIKQLSIFVENRTGKLVECMQVLANAGVDIRALSIADTQDFGILRLIVNDSNKALEALKNDGFVVKVNEVVGISIDDSSGSLCKVVDLLSSNGVNIEYMYAFITVLKQNVYIVLRVEDNDACAKLLTENGIQLIDESDVQGI